MPRGATGKSGSKRARSGLTLLVDASSLIYRAFFAVPDTVRAPDGTQVNAAYGFLEMISNLAVAYRPRYMVACLDDDWRPQWRVDLIDSYKTHRVAAEDAEVLPSPEDQIDLIVELLGMAGVATLGAEGYEAEDVIGALVPRAPGEVAIVSGDRDLFQLVRDPTVRVLYPKRGVSDLAVIDETEIEARYGIPGARYFDFAVLRGDPSDGLPGVRGIGEKTASSLIAKYGSLDAVVAASKGATSGPLAKVAASLDYIERARTVVRIASEAPIGNVDASFPQHGPHDKLAATAEANGLSGPVKRLIAAMASP
ncbi:MAG TPA: 5'-3' exonuclease [Actinomycetota bacterium]|nr:5'-3' exonuclease [Actinomycetota bacterium]